MTTAAAVALALTACGQSTHTDESTSEAPATTTGESTTGSTTDDNVTTLPNTVTTNTQETTSTTGPVEPEPPDVFCPGDPQGICDPDPDARLHVGAGVVSILPNCWESWKDVNDDFKYHFAQDEFYDCGCDRLCEGDFDYVGPDAGEGDGIFQTVWMGGFGNGRATLGPRKGTDGWFGGDDGIWARSVVFEQGSSTLAIVTLDVVGFFNDDVERVRGMLADANVDVDYLLVHSTHNHEGPDTMGLWGEKLGITGYDETYMTQVREAIVTSIQQAIADKREVKEMVVGAVDASSYSGSKGVANIVRDSRDPVVIDESLSAARFVAQDDTTIATLISFGNHPETLADDNLYLTSDYVHALRRGVEQGTYWFNNVEGKPGVGGTALFLNSAVGGMMTTLGITVATPDGNEYSAATFQKADAVGQVLGEMALDALAGGDAYPDPKLSFQAKFFLAELQNVALQTMYDIGVLDREICSDPMTQEDRFCTEMALITVGPLEMLSVPGELLPELAIGGYDGSHVGSDEYSFIDPGNPNPPNVTDAPDGPYLKDRMAGSYRWIIGLGNDEIGYIIPEYDFKLADSMPYINEAEGDHYEETNSLGPKTAGQIDAISELLTDWSQRPR